jgi:hypothetical protein
MEHVRRIENHCCDCAVPSSPCRGEFCPLRRVEVYYCDVCRDEIYGDVYLADGTELCEDCLKDKFRKEI